MNYSQMIACNAAAVLAAATAALAQSNQPEGAFDLSWYTIDGGEATFVAGGGFELGGTIGQSDTGPSGGPITGGDLALVGGFWPDASSGTGAPAASVVDAFSRNRCDLPVNIDGQVQNADVTSEPRLGGISDLYISFDVAPGGPGANPVTLYQPTGCPVGSQAACAPYAGANEGSPSAWAGSPRRGLLS